MSEPIKVKAIDLMVTELEPLILENGFKKFRKGYYVRMKGEILQYVYCHTLRPTFDVRFGALPYWAADAELLAKKKFDSLGSKDVSELADKLDGHDDYERWQIDPSYRRWECWNAETLQPILPLFKEKLLQYVFPMLDKADDFNGYIAMQKQLADLRGYDYFPRLPDVVVKELCICEGKYDCVFEYMEKVRRKKKNEFLAEKAKAKMYYDIERAKQMLQDSLDVTDRVWREFTDAARTGTPIDVFGEELSNHRIQRKEAMRKLLKLEIE